MTTRYQQWALAALAVQLGIGLAIFKMWALALCSAGFGLFVFCSSFIDAGKTGWSKKHFLRLGSVTWSREDFFRHWLIVGRSGCGKTAGAFRSILIQVTQSAPNWGGVCIDEKGNIYRIVARIMDALREEKKLIVLRTRQPGAPADWKPPYRMNLIGDQSLPYRTLAQVVVDVAVSQGQKTSQAFFKNQALDLMADIFETVVLSGLQLTLENAFEFMKLEYLRAVVLRGLAENKEERAAKLALFWKDFFKTDGGQLSGVKGTVENYLRPYTDPAIVEVFCSDDPNITFAEIDQGKIFCTSVTQVHVSGRRYVNAFFKMYFYLHVLRRFDLDRDDFQNMTPLILFADEGQNSILASEEGLADKTTLDKLREAGGTAVFLMQDFVSAIPPSEGEQNADVLFTNLNNKIIFAVENPKGREIASKQFGMHDVAKYSYTTGQGSRSTTRSTEEKPRFNATFFGDLKQFECVVKHCEGKWERIKLRPPNDDGRYSSWWSRRKGFRVASRPSPASSVQQASDPTG